MLELAMAGFIFLIGSCVLGATMENMTFKGIAKIKEEEDNNGR